jgi:hypothetical protein
VIEGKYTPKVVAKIIKLFLFFFAPFKHKHKNAWTHQKSGKDGWNRKEEEITQLE